MFDNSTHPIYKKANCIYDCHVKISFETCKCVPWDFVNIIKGATECDIFGRTCFFNMIETLAHGSDQNCNYCIGECDSIKYRRRVKESIKLDLIEEVQYVEYDDYYAEYNHYVSYHCNKYICIVSRLR